MSERAHLVSLATAVPPHCLQQSDVAAAARDAFASRFEGFRALSRVFASSGILQRYAARPLEWYFQPLGWTERNRAYLEAAVDLFVEAASLALARAGLKAAARDPVLGLAVVLHRLAAEGRPFVTHGCSPPAAALVVPAAAERQREMPAHQLSIGSADTPHSSASRR